MKVLLVSSKYPPEYSGSGLRAHRTHLRLVEKFGIETEVICSSTEFLSPKTYVEDGLNVTRVVSSLTRRANSILGKGPLRRLTNAAVFRSEMKQVTKLLDARSPDVVHVFGYSPATMAAIRWAKNNNVPLMRELVNVVDSPYQYPPGEFGNQVFEFPYQSIVVAISAELGEISNRAGLTENVWVRPNPVDEQRFHFADESERHEARLRLTPFAIEDTVIVFVSKFRKSKNHEFLLEVLAKLPENYKLVLAGPPSSDIDIVPGLRTDEIYDLKKRAEAMGMHGRVFTKSGFVDAADYLRAGDVFCMPAEREAMGTPLLEALATGLRVVANQDESSFREWIENGRNGFLRPLDASAWADAILETQSFSNSNRKDYSEQIIKVVSEGLIDEQYQKLLQALSDTASGDSLNVTEVLST